MDDAAAAALTRARRGARRGDATRDPVGHAGRSEEGAACMVVLSISDWRRRLECMSTWRRYWWSEVLIPLQSTRALGERRRFCLLAGNGTSRQCGYVSSMAQM